MADDDKDLNDVYEDRNLLACAFALATDNDSGWKPDPDSPEEWAIVWAELPTGQVSWHVPRTLAEDFGPQRSGVMYDGYDREIKNNRLAAYCYRNSRELRDD